MHTEKQIKVWDPLLRLSHWALALGFSLAYLSGDAWMEVHVWLGYGLGGIILLRLVWGFIGPRHARFSDFVRSPAAVLAYAWEILRQHPRRYLGHNPAGGAMVVALLASIAATVVSGLVLYGYTEFSGPLAGWLSDSHLSGDGLEDIHEFCANFTLVLVALHLLGVAAASGQHRENLARSMVTGYKREQD